MPRKPTKAGSVINSRQPTAEGFTGPGPFTTRGVVFDADNRQRLWQARHHRKTLALPDRMRVESLVGLLLRSLWQPRKLNWWIGIIFAIGASGFAIASVYALSVRLAAAAGVSPADTNRIYFISSIAFTLAAYLQLYQAANSDPVPGTPASEAHDRSATRAKVFGWKPLDVGWLSCALQFVGTLLFNVNTYCATIQGLTWKQVDLFVWVPNFVGSILFLASGYLAFVEACHSFWAWRHASLTWWIVFINLLGCVCFMVSAVFAPVFSDTPNAMAMTISISATLMGAICFLVGSLLMLPEAAIEEFDA